MITSINIMISVKLGHNYPRFSFFFFPKSGILAWAKAIRTSLFFIKYVAIHTADPDFHYFSRLLQKITIVKQLTEGATELFENFLIFNL